MELAGELRRALDGICAAGAPEVRENGEWLAGLEGVQYEVSAQNGTALLHLWSGEQSLVRRVLRVAEQSAGRVVLEVRRFGYARPAQLELVAGGARRETRRVEREQFSLRLRRLLTDHFPDETVESLATAADLHRSLSGSYTRGITRRRSEAYAVLAASPNEDAATIDGILTFGLIWLQLARDRARKYSVHGLRLFLPHRTSTVTAHRMAALAAPQEVELYEYERPYWRVLRIARSNAGNLATWVVARREIEQAIAAAMPLAEHIRRLAPEAIGIGVAAAAQEVTLRFRGLEFARWRRGEMWFGLGERQEALTPARWPSLEALVRQLDTHRHALALDTRHRLYRAQPERWLETMVAADPARIDARLDPRHIYAQVPAFSSGDRGIIDLLAVTRDRRLAVIELKASEDDIYRGMEAESGRGQEEQRRLGAQADFREVSKPLKVVLPVMEAYPQPVIDRLQGQMNVLRYLSPEIEVARVALSENWRRGLRVLFRQ